MTDVKVTRCAWELPRTLFDLDDEDYAVVKTDPIPADQEELAEQSIAECPRAALTSQRLEVFIN